MRGLPTDFCGSTSFQVKYLGDGRGAIDCAREHLPRMGAINCAPTITRKDGDPFLLVSLLLMKSY